jgi:hypothetical protein
MVLALSHEESEFLVALLEKCLGELREEVYHAEVSGYKDQLKSEEETLRALLLKLRQAA